MVEQSKKFELMLTRHAKAYSSSCSQTVSLSPVISSQFIVDPHGQMDHSEAIVSARHTSV